LSSVDIIGNNIFEEKHPSFGLYQLTDSQKYKTKTTRISVKLFVVVFSTGNRGVAFFIIIDEHL